MSRFLISERITLTSLSSTPSVQFAIEIGYCEYKEKSSIFQSTPGIRLSLSYNFVEVEFMLSLGYFIKGRENMVLQRNDGVLPKNGLKAITPIGRLPCHSIATKGIYFRT